MLAAAASDQHRTLVGPRSCMPPHAACRDGGLRLAAPTGCAAVLWAQILPRVSKRRPPAPSCCWLSLVGVAPNPPRPPPQINFANRSTSTQGWRAAAYVQLQRDAPPPCGFSPCRAPATVAVVLLAQPVGNCLQPPRAQPQRQANRQR